GDDGRADYYRQQGIEQTHHDGGSDPQLGQGGEDADHQDGDVGAGGEEAAHSGTADDPPHDVAHCRSEVGGHHHDEDRHEYVGQVGDDPLDEVGHGVGAEHTEGELQ